MGLPLPYILLYTYVLAMFQECGRRCIKIDNVKGKRVKMENRFQDNNILLVLLQNILETISQNAKDNGDCKIDMQSQHQVRCPSSEFN